ncbi:hypothetical protein PAXRUDRAFT_823640 [Paxillus rubicundulus Ve08.2h10]|uniref:Uncharacterized protein n=1 Tax=Paxillus rubicundulus Ve08.2h10 TaxID=930991 RepID=A0A0D0DVC0_9AGAM|nr:hypothetical protein PAXRUDRAFT_823640 [Paxillus rubicundulus Ve08.2h10]
MFAWPLKSHCDSGRSCLWEESFASHPRTSRSLSATVPREWLPPSSFEELDNRRNLLHARTLLFLSGPVQPDPVCQYKGPYVTIFYL